MPLQFDIRAILREKAPKVHVPDFLIRYLERIVHVKQMNAFLLKYPDLEGYDFIRRVLDEELCCTASIDGIENIPTDGKPVICISFPPSAFRETVCGSSNGLNRETHSSAGM